MQNQQHISGMNDDQFMNGQQNMGGMNQMQQLNKNGTLNLF